MEPIVWINPPSHAIPYPMNTYINNKETNNITGIKQNYFKPDMRTIDFNEFPQLYIWHRKCLFSCEATQETAHIHKSGPVSYFCS